MTGWYRGLWDGSVGYLAGGVTVWLHGGAMLRGVALFGGVSGCAVTVWSHGGLVPSPVARCLSPVACRPARQIHDLNHMWLSQNSYGTGIAVQIG